MENINSFSPSSLTTLAKQLRSRAWRMATAESCTGGWIAKVCTDLPGSSEWFDSGFVTYSNTAKQQMLGVTATSLADYGAVSEVVVAEMATGALLRSAAQVSVAVSGIAGPGGKTVDKPVGLICFAWKLEQQPVQTESQYFAGDREAIRWQTVEYALAGLVKRLQD